MSTEYTTLNSNSICKVDTETNKLEVFTLFSNTNVIQQVVDKDNTNRNNLSLDYENDRFINWQGKQWVEVEYKKLCIENYTPEDYKKYAKKKQTIFVNESYTDYLASLNVRDLRPAWIMNIFHHRAEEKRILYESNDIIFMLDMKCTITKEQLEEFKQNTTINTDSFVREFPNFYALVLFKGVRIATIRDLSSSEVEYLERINVSIINFLEENYKIPPKYTRLFFHYPPSFYYLHLHVNLTTTSDANYSMDHCYPLNQVIKNLRQSDMYYKENMTISQMI